MSSCTTHTINVKDLKHLLEIIRYCFETSSKKCCITTFLRELLLDIDRGKVRAVNPRKIGICISDPNDIRCGNAEKCLRELLCRKNQQETERCPDLVIFYKDVCSYVEVKNHISNTDATHLSNILKNAENKFSSRCVAELEEILKKSCKKMVFLNVALPKQAYDAFKKKFIIVEKDSGLIINKLRDF